MIADLPHTRPFPFAVGHQAALAHLESIIYNPFETNDIQDGVDNEDTKTQTQRVAAGQELTATEK